MADKHILKNSIVWKPWKAKRPARSSYKRETFTWIAYVGKAQIGRVIQETSLYGNQYVSVEAKSVFRSARKGFGWSIVGDLVDVQTDAAKKYVEDLYLDFVEKAGLIKETNG